MLSGTESIVPTTSARAPSGCSISILISCPGSGCRCGGGMHPGTLHSASSGARPPNGQQRVLHPSGPDELGESFC
jgi:hypothetical protein